MEAIYPTEEEFTLNRGSGARAVARLCPEMTTSDEIFMTFFQVKLPRTVLVLPKAYDVAGEETKR